MSKRTIIAILSILNIVIPSFFILQHYTPSDLTICIINLFALIIISPWMTSKLVNIFSSYSNQLIRICVSLALPGMAAFLFGFLSAVIFTFIDSPMNIIFSQLVKTPIYGIMTMFFSVFIWLFIGILNFIILSIIFKKKIS